MTRRLALLVLFVALAARPAGAAGDGSARETYNRAVAAFEVGDLDAAEKAFLEARDGAGGDAELRFSAAFNLGMTFAARAEGLAAEKPEEAVEALRQGAAWFRDAVRLRPGEDDARVNLEIVLLRLQELADRLNQGQNGLEARLDRVIEDQRGVRGAVQELMTRVDAAGATADPVAFQDAFRALEQAERQLLADLNTVGDLAVDEIGHLEGKPEAERTDEDRMRLAGLEALEPYLERARTEMADARRLLLRLQGDRAHRAADAALAWAKRAREQLQDPVTVLQGIAEDELLLRDHTALLEKLGRGELTLQGGDEPARAPPWLTAAHLADRQRDARDRTLELLARLEAGVAGADPAAASQPIGGGAAGGDDPRRRRVVAAAREATPLVRTSAGAMGDVTATLGAGDLTGAVAAETAALAATFQAMELFSDLRGLIELSTAEQQQVVALLTPGDDSGLSTEERAARLADGVGRNRGRVARLAGLIADEVALLGDDPNDPKSEERELYRLAETERQGADEALTALDALLRGGGGSPGEALARAQEALARLEALRRLFYTIVEHLKELARHQADTHDRTGAPDAEVGPLADAQRRHAEVALALAGALETQADQAAQAQAQDPQAAEAAQKLAGASAEVRAAEAAMQKAAAALADAQTRAGTMSVDLQPALALQKEAMDHLANAIRLLEPPQEQPQDQPQQQEQQQQQVSKEEAARRLQEIRDREAEREREKRKRQRIQNEPVEKDW